MITSVIHAGGTGTRLRESYDGPKALAPIDGYPLLWYHFRPLIDSKLVTKYLFTLMNEPQLIQDYVNQYASEQNLDVSYIIEPRPLGRAGSVRYAFEKDQINLEYPCLMSYPDDLIPIKIQDLLKYAEESSELGKTLILVMAKKTVSPFGIGITSENKEIIELESFLEKPELPLIANHYANTGMALYMPEALEMFKEAPLDKKTHPEDYIVPKLIKNGKAAVYLVERWLSVNYASDYQNVQKIGKERLVKFLQDAGS